MSSFKVGDTVILTQNEEELSRFTDWAQMLITTKARCMVTSVNERTLRAKVLEGKERYDKKGFSEKGKNNFVGNRDKFKRIFNTLILI